VQETVLIKLNNRSYNDLIYKILQNKYQFGTIIIDAYSYVFY